MTLGTASDDGGLTVGFRTINAASEKIGQQSKVALEYWNLVMRPGQ